jgi:hypothetical protein
MDQPKRVHEWSYDFYGAVGMSGGSPDDYDDIAEADRPYPAGHGTVFRPDEPPSVPWASASVEDYVLGLLDRLDEVE